jgi:hypothetical protein
LLSQSSSQDSLLAQPIFRPRLLACSADASGQDSLLDLGLVEYPGQRPFFAALPQPLR